GVELNEASKKLDSVVDTYSAVLLTEVESVKDSKKGLDERYQIEKEGIYRVCEEKFIHERDVIVEKLNLKYMEYFNILKNIFDFYCQTYNSLQELKSLGRNDTVDLSTFHQRHIETMHKIIFSNPADFDPIIDDMCHELDIVYGLHERILDLKKEIV